MMTGENTGLGVWLMMEELRRGLPGKQTWVDAGYCIDAPNVMAAGSTIRDEFGPLDDDWVAMPSLIERDAPNLKVTGAPRTEHGEANGH